LDAADHIGNIKRKQRQAKRTFHTVAAKCLAAKGGIFENVLKQTSVSIKLNMMKLNFYFKLILRMFIYYFALYKNSFERP